MPAEQYAADGAEGVERLGDVETARGCLGGAHGEDVGVGGGLEDGAAAGHHVDGKEEEGIGCGLARGIEQHGAGGVEGQAEQDAALVAEPADEEGRRKGEAEVCPVEGELHEGGLQVGHRHDAPERSQQRVVHVVRDSPEKEEETHEHERQT